MKSQSAIEFLSIVSLGMIILVITSYMGYSYVNNYFFDTNSLNAKQTAKITASAANLIYAQGLNASSKVSVKIPYNILRNRTYINEKEINIRFSDPPRDAIGFAAANMTGAFPLKEG